MATFGAPSPIPVVGQLEIFHARSLAPLEKTRRFGMTFYRTIAKLAHYPDLDSLAYMSHKKSGHAKHLPRMPALVRTAVTSRLTANESARRAGQRGLRNLLPRFGAQNQDTVAANVGEVEHLGNGAGDAVERTTADS